MKKKRFLEKFLFNLIIIIFCFVAIFPLYWMINTSLQKRKVIFSFPPRFYPCLVGLGNYLQVLLDPLHPLPLWIVNGLYVGLVTAGASVGLAIWASYSIASFRYRGKNAVFFLFLATQTLPPILVIVPIFMVFAKLGLVDSLQGLILINMSFIIPACIWFLRGFIDSIPPDLEAAAMVDGCSRVGAFIRVTLPLLLPGIMATFIFSFLVVWDEYLFARVLLRNPGKWVPSIGVASFIGQFVTPWSSIMAAATITSLPAILLFILFQRYLLSGLTGGAIKE